MATTVDIRDPIHGYIRLSSLEAELVDTPEFQRLRNIGQLGLTHLVYPGATHNRFSHSLGVMHLAGRVFDHLCQQSPDTLLPQSEKRGDLRRRLRAAALLHDVGHSPFSHALEGLFPDGIDHESMAGHLILTGGIATVLRRYDIDPRGIAAFLDGTDGEAAFMHQILSGELDVDKMDYLLRDSHYCGVAYGSYDLDRLLYTMTLIGEDGRVRIGVLDGGVHALEAFVLARYYMFTQVYFDATSKILEAHLQRFVRSRVGTWPREAESFLGCDDIAVIAQLRDCANDPSARRVLDRDHFPLAYETDEHMDRNEERRFSSLLKGVLEAFPAGTIHVSTASKDPHRFDRADVRVLHRDGKLQSITDRSSFIGKLKRINRIRVYAVREYRDDVREMITRRLPGTS